MAIIPFLSIIYIVSRAQTLGEKSFLRIFQIRFYLLCILFQTFKRNCS